LANCYDRTTNNTYRRARISQQLTRWVVMARSLLGYERTSYRGKLQMSCPPLLLYDASCVC
jgi:hypothetical protein